LAKNSTGQRGRRSPASQRKPVTIDLSAEQVKKDEGTAGATASATQPDQSGAQPGSEKPEAAKAEATAAGSGAPKAAEPGSSKPEAAAAAPKTPEPEGKATAGVGSQSASQSTKSEPKSQSTATTSAASGGASAAAKSDDKGKDDQDKKEAAKPSAPTASASAARETPKAPAATPASRGTSFVALLAAAVIGGAIAAIAVVALLLSGYLAPREEEGPDLQAEIATLKSDVAALSQAPQEDNLAPLRDQISALQTSVTDLQSAAQAAQTAQTDGTDTGELDDLKSRVSQLETNASQVASGAVSDDVGQQLAARIATLSQDVDALKSAPGPDLSGLESGLADLRQQVATLTTDLKSAPTEERVAAIETKLSDIGTQLGDLTTKLDDVTRKVDLAAALGPAVAADALAAAVDTGRPFTSELAALGALGVDPTAIAALQPDAEKGLPTLDVIRSRFETEVASIDLSTPLPEGTGTFDRLMQSARGLVEVRPSNPTAGADPSAIMTRIRAALAAGDLSTALSEWNTLPDEIKTQSADWADIVKTRAAADDLVAQLRSEALAKLGTENTEG
jgi:hypothetical protein